jgi:hypothetical protein
MIETELQHPGLLESSHAESLSPYEASFGSWLPHVGPGILLTKTYITQICRRTGRKRADTTADRG